MKKLLIAVPLVLATFWVQAASACDMKLINHTNSSISIASFWVLNYGTTDLDFMNVAPKSTICYKKSDYDKKSWVIDKKSVLKEGRIILHLEGSLAKYLDHTYSAYVHHGKTLHVYNEKVEIK